LFVVLLIVGPSFQELGPPTIPGRFTTADAGLSLGDRFCLALALRDGLPAWTADKAWRTIADAAKVKVVLIR
jgi:PIN domain nuclease of toxin-antitoxin system